MSSIQPNLSSFQSYPQLGQSLVNLSARTQSAATADPSASATVSADASVPADLVQEIASQNQFSALADSTAALGANQFATGLLSSQPTTASAYAAQSTLSPETVLGLLQD
jgi:hypothetical protein